MNDLIEKLRSVKWEVIDDDDWDSRCVFVDMRPDDFDALLTEAAAALEAAREDACVALVADIRFACGDNGKRSQPELVEYIRGLARDAARYRLLRARWGRIADEYDGDSDRLVAIREADSHFAGWDVDPLSLDRAIDAAMQRTSGGDHE